MLGCFFACFSALLFFASVFKNQRTLNPRIHIFLYYRGRSISYTETWKFSCLLEYFIYRYSLHTLLYIKVVLTKSTGHRTWGECIEIPEVFYRRAGLPHAVEVEGTGLPSHQSKNGTKLLYLYMVESGLRFRSIFGRIRIQQITILKTGSGPFWRSPRISSTI